MKKRKNPKRRIPTAKNYEIDDDGNMVGKCISCGCECSSGNTSMSMNFCGDCGAVVCGDCCDHTSATRCPACAKKNVRENPRENPSVTCVLLPSDVPPTEASLPKALLTAPTPEAVAKASSRIPAKKLGRRPCVVRVHMIGNVVVGVERVGVLNPGGDEDDSPT